MSKGTNVSELFKNVAVTAFSMISGADKPEEVSERIEGEFAVEHDGVTLTEFVTDKLFGRIFGADDTD